MRETCPLVERLLNEFQSLTGLTPPLDASYAAAVGAVGLYLQSKSLLPLPDRKRAFLAHVNAKFRLNAAAINQVWAHAAKNGRTFNFRQKQRIQRAFDYADRDEFEFELASSGISSDLREELIGLFEPFAEQDTIRAMQAECSAPSRLRREVGDRDICGEILKAQFSAFVWVSLPEREMHEFFDDEFEESAYEESYWSELQRRCPQLFGREHALYILRVPTLDQQEAPDYLALRSQMLRKVAAAYESLDNHGYLAVLVDAGSLDRPGREWELTADLVLFAEKHREVALRQGYFRPSTISEETRRYIPSVRAEDARFEVANEGFTYRDCFVLTGSGTRVRTLLLVFQKNARDETAIPCPRCRSHDVRGNSYPALGVRSWECRNPLCPDRSKYNRGKRFSFKGLAMQQAIEDERNLIPPESVRRWLRDVVEDASDAEILDMLIRHYSMCGDTIRVDGALDLPANSLGRQIIMYETPLSSDDVDLFWTSSWFARYAVRKRVSPVALRDLGSEPMRVYCGDSSGVLRAIDDDSIGAAVTSPPYYNARDYSQWPNLYCHLHDMMDIAEQVYRCLAPGGLYAYNVFDYFDNERTVALSAMGEKRLPLSAYTVDLFRRVGFEIVGCVVWDKGDIEGKRGFNGGNFSPFYQSPFNCWEHVLIFRKPHGAESNVPPEVGHVLRQTPVLKMVQGRNIHGHTAPFPDRIPEIIIKVVPGDAVILDPFAGSLTTGRVAARWGRRSIMVEQHMPYCDLGLRIFHEEQHPVQPRLLETATSYSTESASTS